MYPTFWKLISFFIEQSNERDVIVKFTSKRKNTFYLGEIVSISSLLRFPEFIFKCFCIEHIIQVYIYIYKYNYW